MNVSFDFKFNVCVQVGLVKLNPFAQELGLRYLHRLAVFPYQINALETTKHAL